MKFAICNETFAPPVQASFTPWTFQATCQCAARLGYQGIELAPFTFQRDVRKINSAERASIRHTAEETGLEIIGLHWLLAQTEGFHLTSPDPLVRDATRRYGEALIDFCAQIGGKLLVWGSPKQRDLAPGVSREQGFTFAAEIFRALMPRCAEWGVTLCIEPLARSETNFLNTAADAAQLIARVGHPHCALHLDVKAMSDESRPIPEIIFAHKNLLRHFHANDPNRRGPGQGAVDHKPIAAALREIDYSGYVSVEVFDYTPDPETIARQSIAYLKSVYL